MRQIALLIFLAFESVIFATNQNPNEIIQMTINDAENKKQKSRYEEEVVIDLNQEVSYGSFNSIGQMSFDNDSLLYQKYIEMMRKYPQEYQNALMTIFNAAVENRKRSQKIVSRSGINEVNFIPNICIQIEDNFVSKAKESGDDIKSASFRGMHDATKAPQSKEEMQKIFQKLVKEAVTEALKNNQEEIPVDDTQAIEDTAMLFGQFLTTQAKHGMDPNPAELVNFLGSIDFIAMAPLVAGCLSKTFNCGPQATRITYICSMVTAVLLTAAFYGLGLAIQFGAFDGKDSHSLG